MPAGDRVGSETYRQQDRTCGHCGLRLRYTTKGSGTGDYRAIGPPPDQVEQAQMELQETFKAHEINEKIFNGKLMEIRGRSLVETRQGASNGAGPADEKLGEALMASSTCHQSQGPMTPYPGSKEMNLTTSPRKRSPEKPSAKPEIKTDLTKEEIKENDLQSVKAMSVSSKVSSSVAVVDSSEVQAARELLEKVSKGEILPIKTEPEEKAQEAE